MKSLRLILDTIIEEVFCHVSHREKLSHFNKIYPQVEMTKTQCKVYSRFFNDQ